MNGQNLTQPNILVQPKIQGNKIILEIPRKILEKIFFLTKEKEQQTTRSYLKKYKGILENRITIDPLEYEKNIRSEWDRNLDQ
ncbi:hypothetical protein L6278_01525 [Candidatus Parcubacteria bacterium]|nr:hypothetical protein [Candidatus Parcubacteria bacterium]